MSIHVVVRNPFGDHKRGDILMGADAQTVLVGEHAHDVTRAISAPSHLSGDFWKEVPVTMDAPAPATKAAPIPRFVDRSR